MLIPACRAVYNININKFNKCYKLGVVVTHAFSPVLGRRGQADLYEFEALVYREVPSQPQLHNEILLLKRLL